MDIAGKEKVISWSASIGIHFGLLIAAAAMGLFAVAAPPEKRPIEVEIYDTAAPASAPAAAAQAAAPPPPPSIDDIQFEKPKKEPEPQPQQEQPRETPRQSTAANTNASSTSSTDTGANNAPTSSNANNGGGSDSNAPAGNSQSSKRPKVPPRNLSTPQPVYPEVLRSQGITGVVVVRFVVTADGSVQDATAEQSSGYPEMDQAAIAAIYNTPFSPAQNEEGEPVSAYTRIPVRFNLK
ncbi:energy transducer TonB [Selenomonas artemidis]|uniref:energy transducer TonB n=1 Tax=Selenomonas artemidis TaxID=671224 RepID=UPI0028894D53|nr:energy transducer TonB [Selenomonas artemidis]